MSKFTDVMATNPPRIVIQYMPAPADNSRKETYDWGIVGNMPILNMVGAITRIQSELVFRAAEPCDATALVIVWDAAIKKITWYVHPDIPIDPLIGMMEVVKATLMLGNGAVLPNQQQQPAKQQTRLFGPDGTPMRF